MIPDEKTINKLIEENISLVVLDHHKTNESKIGLIPECVFDLSKSGCVIAWEYFRPSEPVPLFLRYLQDRDIWQWQMENSREISAFVQSLEFDFDVWTVAIEGIENIDLSQKYVEYGKLILKYQKILSKDIVEDNRQLVDFEGHKAWAVNSSVLSDEIGERLYADLPLAIIWQQRSESITVGLRSDRTVDAGLIARKHGGGGHVGAAGFELPAGSPLPWKVIKE